MQGNFDQAAQWSERILKVDANNVNAKQLLDWARNKDNSKLK